MRLLAFMLLLTLPSCSPNKEEIETNQAILPQKLFNDLSQEYKIYLGGWTLMVDDAHWRLGQCRHKKKEIGISKFHLIGHSVDNVNDTLYHEVAHAIAGYKAKHGPEWATWYNYLKKETR